MHMGLVANTEACGQFEACQILLATGAAREHVRIQLAIQVILDVLHLEGSLRRLSAVAYCSLETDSEPIVKVPLDHCVSLHGGFAGAGPRKSSLDVVWRPL